MANIGGIRAVAGVKRPAVVLFNEWPGLDGQTDLDWVAVDVIDGASYLVRMVEKNFPAAARGPGGMVGASQFR